MGFLLGVDCPKKFIQNICIQDMKLVIFGVLLAVAIAVLLFIHWKGRAAAQRVAMLERELALASAAVDDMIHEIETEAASNSTTSNPATATPATSGPAPGPAPGPAQTVAAT